MDTAVDGVGDGEARYWVEVYVNVPEVPEVPTLTALAESAE